MTDVQTRPETGNRPEQPGHTGTVPTRRAVLAGAGALGATCFLAACGTDNRGGSGDNEAGYTNDPLPAGSAGTDGSGSTSGGGIIKGAYVITQPDAGTFKAFSKVCTHQGCDVSKVDGGVIICPCHGSEFSIQNGSPQGGPASRPLPEQAVKVNGDNVVTA